MTEELDTQLKTNQVMNANPLAGRKVIFSMMVSLDGFYKRLNEELDWVIIDEEIHTFVNDMERTAGTYLYGRRMYELLNEYWPTADLDPSNPDFVIEFARIWKSIPKIVFSNTLKEVEGNARLVRGNIADEIMILKEQPGGDLEVGGANIASTLMRLGLIDEYRIFIEPVILGSGAPVFPALNAAIHLRLVETHTFTSGVVFLRYLRAG